MEATFQQLDKSKRKVFEVTIWTELGCSFNDSEYSLDIAKIKQGRIEEDDFQYVKDCIEEHFSDEKLPEEGPKTVTVYEDGEWQDHHWCKWYSLEP